MSISKLALVVFAVLAGTAVSVQSYLESRRPFALSPRVLVREMPELPWAPRPEPSDAAPGSLSAPAFQELAREPVTTTPSVASAPAAGAPASVVEAAAPEPTGDVSRWIKVRRDGQGRAASCGSGSRSRATTGCAPRGAAPAPTRGPAPAAATQVGVPTQVRLD